MDGGAEESGYYTYALQRWLFVGKGVPLRLVRPLVVCDGASCSVA